MSTNPLSDFNPVELFKGCASVVAVVLVLAFLAGAALVWFLNKS